MKRVSCMILLSSLVLLAGYTPVKAQEQNYFQSGLQSYFQENYEEARTNFQKAVNQDTESARLQFFLGNTLKRLGDTVGAIKQYRRALSIREGHQSARRKLADIFFQNGDWSNSIEQYQYLVRRNPETFLFHYRLGIAYFNQGKNDKAKERFLRARNLNSRSAKAHFYLGRVLMREGEYLNAASRFNRAIELDSTEGLYYFYKGLAHFREQDYRSRNDSNWRSATNFQKAIEKGFDSPRTRFMYGNTLLNRGLHYKNNDRIKEAIHVLKKSIREYRKVLSGDWRASNAFHNMGVSYLVIGKLGFAKEAVEKAILAEPDVSFFHHTLGEIYFRLGKFDKAIESWNLAQELDSDYENHPFEPLLFNEPIDQRIEEAKLRR